MLETVTTLFTTVFVVALLRRWLLGAQANPAQRVPSVFCIWLSSTVAFARYGCDYLAWATSLYSGGDFSVTLMFRTYTFLGTPESVRTFTRAPSAVLALQPAVEQFTEKNFGLPAELWEDGEAKPAGILRSILSLSMLTELQQQLCITQLQLHEQYFPSTVSGETKVDIASTIPRWVMHASLIALFGKPFVETINLQAFLSQFNLFDTLFEAAASPLPGFLFPKFHSARAFLLAELRKGLDNSLFAGTIADSVILHCGLPSNVHANVLLALLWAGLTNVSATAFWTIGFLLLPCHQHWRTAVEQQLTAACKSHSQQESHTDDPNRDTSVFPEQKYKLLAEGLVAAALGGGEKSLIMGCVHEALRLRAQGIVLRKAVAPLQLPTATSTTSHHKNAPKDADKDSSSTSSHPQNNQHTLPTHPTVIQPGSLVAISPYQLHHDPRFFSEPHLFDPSRHCAVNQCPAKPSRNHNSSSSDATALPHGCPASIGVSNTSDVNKHPGERQEAGGLRVAFGAGLFRCPGRSLALAQASLSIAVFLACTDACLCTDAAVSKSGLTGNHVVSTSASTSAEQEDCRSLPAGKTVPRWLQAEVVPGAHIVARGVSSGDPQCQLPRFDARQLVGVKKPIEPLYAVCKRSLHVQEACEVALLDRS